MWASFCFLIWDWRDDIWCCCSACYRHGKINVTIFDITVYLQAHDLLNRWPSAWELTESEKGRPRGRERQWQEHCVLLPVFAYFPHVQLCVYRDTVHCFVTSWSHHIRLLGNNVHHSKSSFCMNNVSFTTEILSLWLYGHVPPASLSPQRINHLQRTSQFFFQNG